MGAIRDRLNKANGVAQTPTTRLADDRDMAKVREFAAENGDLQYCTPEWVASKFPALRFTTYQLTVIRQTINNSRFDWR